MRGVIKKIDVVERFRNTDAQNRTGPVNHADTAAQLVAEILIIQRHALKRELPVEFVIGQVLDKPPPADVVAIIGLQLEQIRSRSAVLGLVFVARLKPQFVPFPFSLRAQFKYPLRFVGRVSDQFRGERQMHVPRCAPGCRSFRGDHRQLRGIRRAIRHHGAPVGRRRIHRCNLLRRRHVVFLKRHLTTRHAKHAKPFGFENNHVALLRHDGSLEPVPVALESE